MAESSRFGHSKNVSGDALLSRTLVERVLRHCQFAGELLLSTCSSSFSKRLDGFNQNLPTSADWSLKSIDEAITKEVKLEMVQSYWWKREPMRDSVSRSLIYNAPRSTTLSLSR